MTNSLQEHLETFRKNYPLTKCLVDNDRIIYVLPFFYSASKSASEANMLIDRLKLPLVAVYYQGCSFFTVQSNETES